MNKSLNKSIPFSLIMPVYLNSNVKHFKEAMNSIISQTLLPSEIILAIDGPINNDMENLIKKFKKDSNIKIIRSSVNIGPGAIRHRAILQAKTEIITVMDSDDISIDNRFEIQIKSFVNKKIDLIGGYIAEFDKSVNDIKQLRKVPLKHSDIIKKGKWIQPFNNVTIMFKKSTYLKSGGYGMGRVLEDSFLFYRMAIINSKFLNIPKTLVYVRADDDQLSRRHGIKYFKVEISLLLSMLNSGYINFYIFIVSLFIRFIFRCSPKFLLVFFNKIFFRSKL